MKCFKTIIVLLALSGCIAAAPAAGQPSNENQAKRPVVPAAMEVINQLAGVWDEAWSYKPVPEFPFIKGSGVLKCTPALGGFYLLLESESTYEGIVSQSLGMIGFNGFGKYVYYNYDERFGKIQQSDGSYNDSTRQITFTGLDYTNAQQKLGVPNKIILTIKDENNFSIETYLINGKEEFKNLISIYTRKK